MATKIYTHCKICKRELQDVNIETGELRPTMSAYPYCGSCAMKSMHNKEFKSFMKGQIRKLKKKIKCQE